ncbi:MAG: phosphoethanolamine methyltransferase [bacterium]|nr:phosphoethanolamine methyltransferase [bacterium]
MKPLNAKHTRDEKLLFLKRWLKNPLQLGSVTPSSRTLSRLIAKHAQEADQNGYILELGAGTGRLTRALIESGVSPDRIYALELDKEFFDFLDESIPGIHAIHGNAIDAPHLLPKKVVGKVTTIITGLPFMSIPFDVQKKIIDACFEVMAPNCQMLQFTYSPTSPIRSKNLGLSRERIATTFRNLPPASVWRYYRSKEETPFRAA